ncbi:hypothetical protein DHW03_06710 [Pedobacter yonginense]|uniref:DUF4175 domain-containing protein n=1 Tax=Pedobacter yonginense TaxID=651869 RepID=A0A317ESV4_9SPHI|nr:DUF4175 family protein [Pedobacter yonginense]PWS29495.1 hypothetical protein DHW03_06710 [Pedobacter yonginense]
MMLKTEGRNWIERFRWKWIALYFAQIAFLSLAIAFILLIIIALCYPYTFEIWHLILAFSAVLICFVLLKPTWKINSADVAKYLNTKFVQLEESAELFLKPKSELTLLEQLQVEKINQHLPIPGSLNEAWKKLALCLAFLLITLGGVVLMDKYYWYEQVIEDIFPTPSKANQIKEVILPEIESCQLRIAPPSYTRRAERTQKQFTLKAETGAKISWSIKTNGSVKKLRIIFNDKNAWNLSTSDHLNWNFSRVISQSGFYQLELNGKKSDLYQMEVIPDFPVRIKITQPKPHTTIDIGQAARVILDVTLTDDYGISETYISATMASGKGEGVSFTEKKLNFGVEVNNKTNIKLNKLIDLKSLGMKPGDELYFFVQAKDNHGQSSRSDVYFVSIVDTTELMSMAGMTNGVNLVPEYFRSQRQIIIDTEKLLKEQGSLSPAEFKNRSNTLGIDQKLLRLRYGQFLGEESETEIGGDHEHEEGDRHEEEKFGDAQAIADKYSHKHDVAEDATFFEPEMKAQLKAVLAEMWTSELRLRTYKPQEALPFEYKALRLLKDLQQKSRAYVAKTTVKTSKLKLEKRLTGELDKITEPVQNATFEQKNRSIDDLKILLSVLENKKTGKSFSLGERQLLRDGEKQLIVLASSQPLSYLAALKSLRKISTSNVANLKDVESVQKAIQKLIGFEPLKPQAKVAGPDVNLYRSYFNHLKNAGR